MIEPKPFEFPIGWFIDRPWYENTDEVKHEKQPLVSLI